MKDDNGVERKVISQKKAKKEGFDRYFTGKPCKHGHVSERYLSGPCVECMKIRDESDEVKEHKKNYLKQYYKNNIEQFKEYSKQYYKNNSEWIKEKGKNYYKENSEHVLERVKYYQQDNKERIKEYKKQYRINNKEHLKEYNSKRYATDENFKISEACRRMLKRTLKATSTTKDSKTYEILGYSNEELKGAVESKFLNGMSWENYGDWHIDHVYPVSRYISEGITDPAIINSLDNLIPMWAEHNLEKKAQTLEEYLDSNPELYDTYGHFLDEEET